jgi:hypothetical protein
LHRALFFYRHRIAIFFGKTGCRDICEEKKEKYQMYKQGELARQVLHVRKERRTRSNARKQNLDMPPNSAPKRASEN